MNSVKRAAAVFLPALVLKGIRERFFRVRWSRPISSWEAAAACSAGYESEDILRRVVEATNLVRSGVAAYEQDGKVFYDEVADQPILAALLRSAALNNGRLSVLDFGGSLGSLYWRYRHWFDGIVVEWSVVEQAKFVEAGKAAFESRELKFYESIETSLANVQPSVLILSAVLPYLEKPHDILKQIEGLSFQMVLIDRTGVQSGGDVLTVQTAPRSLGGKSYPCWFLDEDALKAYFEPRYRLLFSGATTDGNREFKFKRLFYERISSE